MPKRFLLLRSDKPIGLRKGPLPCTFVTRTELQHLARISGYEVVRTRPAAYVPLALVAGAVAAALALLVLGLALWPLFAWVWAAYVALEQLTLRWVYRLPRLPAPPAAKLE